MTLFTDPLYKIDSNNNLRVWYMEYDDEKYRAYSGVNEGKIVVSGWKYPKQKNLGKSNETTVGQQVILEVESKVTNQLAQGQYHDSIEKAKGGSVFIEPMLANKYDKKKHIFPFASQPKLDGMRCLIFKDKMVSRRGKDIISAPHILNDLQPFFDQFPNSILDGELYNHELKSDFEKIISLVRKTKPTEKDLIDSKNIIQFHCYDVVNDKDFENRYTFIMETLNDRFDSIKIVETTHVNNEEELNNVLSLYLEQGYEGQILRAFKGGYVHKRTNALLKNKEFEDGEFEIVDIIEGVGNWAGKAKSVIIKLNDSETQEAGMKGSFEFAEELLKNKNQYIGTDVTVRYQNKTSYGKLRFPVVQTFWKGKRDV